MGDRMTAAAQKQNNWLDQRWTVNLSILFTELPLFERPAAAGRSNSGSSVKRIDRFTVQRWSSQLFCFCAAAVMRSPIQFHDTEARFCLMELSHGAARGCQEAIATKC